MAFMSCLSNAAKTEEFLRGKNDNIPVIALVNGLSGGHKGEKVIRILKKNGIPSFDLALLSSSEEYFDEFCFLINQIYEDIIFEEMYRLKEGERNFHIQPRIIIGGGDGTIAWALSILDRAFVKDEIIRNILRRTTLINGIQENTDDIKLSVKRRLSLKTNISDEFFYANLDEEDSLMTKRYSTNLSPPCVNGKHFNFNENNFEIAIQIKVTPNSSSPSIPYIDIDLEIIPNDIRKADNNNITHLVDDGQYSSSVSLSGNNANQVVEDFMNENLSIYSSPSKCNKPSLHNKDGDGDGDEYKDDDSDDSLSESLVTREELECVIRQKKTTAVMHQKTSLDELRILQTLYDDVRISPVIGLLPLGTGNDLSRCLGTGTVYPGSKYLKTELVSDYKKSPVTKLDRWKIEFRENDKIQTLKNRQCSEMLCYFSVGYEGQITYRFQEARHKNPKLFDRPWKNRIQYVLSGISTGVEEVFGFTKPLNDVIELYVDDKRLKLPSKTRSIVISNIQSMADGVYCWGKGPSTKKDVKDFTKPKLCDGKLEIMASKGIYKYLQMRVGISHYRRLSQSKKVTLITKTDLPIQVDGESWIETPGIIHFYLLHQVFAVVGTNEPRGIRIV